MTTFVLFGALPPEIREGIWELSLPEKRVVKITEEEDEERFRFRNGSKIIWDRVRGVCNIPTALQTCKESRKAAKRAYRLSFATQLSGKPVWFNCKADLLYFDNQHCYKTFMMTFRTSSNSAIIKREVLKAVRHLCISYAYHADYLWQYQRHTFENLETLIFPYAWKRRNSSRYYKPLLDKYPTNAKRLLWLSNAHRNLLRAGIVFEGF